MGLRRTEKYEFMTNEDKRQCVHLGVVLFALLLPWLSKWQTILLALLAIGFNAFLLVRVAPQLYREREIVLSIKTGILAYPLTILLIVLICPWNRKELAAGAWAILAVGDSFSNLIGRHIFSAKLPWNRNKSYAGMIGFWSTALIGCSFFLWWVNPNLGIYWLLGGSALAVLIAGIVETLDINLDDNYTVGLSSLLVLFIFFKYIAP